MSFAAGPDFEALLDYLRRSRGFDFTGYKRTTLLRRVGLRASQVGTQSFSAYLEYLKLNPEEFLTLFNTILINVTEFFRDPDAWDFLAREVLPEIVGRSASDPIRVWSAGCASGEEAYSVAILLGEAMGQNEFPERVKIYATDVDEEALAAARNGYPASALNGLDEKLVDKYFDLQGSLRVFKPRLRVGLIFGRHDLIQDAPISRLDL
ncbi:MAG: protein-glutamate O-methyltransferase CheR, partial [Chloroflexi bacterium]